MSVTGNRGWSPSSLSPLNVAIRHGAPLPQPLPALRLRAYIAARADRPARGARHDAPPAMSPASSRSRPGRGRVHGAAPDGSSGRCRTSATSTGSCSSAHEVQTGVGPHGRPSVGLPGAYVSPTPHLREGRGQRPRARWRRRARRDHRFAAGQLDIHFRRHQSAARGALATLDQLRDRDLQGNAAKQGERMLARLRYVATDLPRGAGGPWRGS